MGTFLRKIHRRRRTYQLNLIMITVIQRDRLRPIHTETKCNKRLTKHFYETLSCSSLMLILIKTRVLLFACVNHFIFNFFFSRTLRKKIVFCLVWRLWLNKSDTKRATWTHSSCDLFFYTYTLKWDKNQMRTHLINVYSNKKYDFN